MDRLEELRLKYRKLGVAFSKTFISWLIYLGFMLFVIAIFYATRNFDSKVIPSLVIILVIWTLLVAIVFLYDRLFLLKINGLIRERYSGFDKKISLWRSFVGVVKEEYRIKTKTKIVESINKIISDLGCKICSFDEDEKIFIVQKNITGNDFAVKDKFGFFYNDFFYIKLINNNKLELDFHNFAYKRGGALLLGTYYYELKNVEEILRKEKII